MLPLTLEVNLLVETLAPFIQVIFLDYTPGVF